jgi:hypothetical protein
MVWLARPVSYPQPIHKFNGTRNQMQIRATLKSCNHQMLDTAKLTTWPFENVVDTSS